MIVPIAWDKVREVLGGAATAAFAATAATKALTGDAGRVDDGPADLNSVNQFRLVGLLVAEDTAKHGRCLWWKALEAVVWVDVLGLL